MRVAFRVELGGIVLSMLILANAFADVRISEFSALSSDRLLQWSDSGVPRLGAGISWRENEFDDASWPSGSAPFGYNYAQVTTDLGSVMHGLTPSLYLRQTFSVTPGQSTSTDDLLLDIDYDDGFIVYLNGKEVARANMGAPGGFCYADQPAFNSHDWTGNETFNLGKVNELLQEGENVIAIQVHKASISAGGLFLDAGLKRRATVSLILSQKEANGAISPAGWNLREEFLTPLFSPAELLFGRTGHEFSSTTANGSRAPVHWDSTPQPTILSEPTWTVCATTSRSSTREKVFS